MKTAVALSVLALLQVVVGGVEVPKWKPYEEQGLKLHNEYRAKHEDTDSMSLDKDLNTVANACADAYINGRKCTKKPAGIGENVYRIDAKVTPIEAVTKTAKKFYAENKNYDYNNPGDNKHGTIEHFTQMVWTASKKLGVGIATKRSSTVVVFLYSQAGNVEDQYAENVMPIKE